MIYLRTRSLGRLAHLLPIVLPLLVACSGDSGVSGPDLNPTGDFELGDINHVVQLVEGDASGTNVPISLARSNGHNATVELSIAGFSEQDSAFISSTFSRAELTLGNDNSSANLRLDIGDRPLLPQRRKFIITATDGYASDKIAVEIDVQPVAAPDVYLLIGQSNMVGFSGDGTKRAQVGQPDQPHPRIRQLNVAKNDQFTIFTKAADYSSPTRNLVVPFLVQAEDPLHVPVNEGSSAGKELDYIGMGISFAKAALNDTTQTIYLVPAAWSGAAFCDNEGGPIGQWNAQTTTDPNLGNTWLFDRAVARNNLALEQTGGILRGILWHQGESDANERCAESYSANLERLAYQLRLSIIADRRGGDLRRPDADIPFVVGTMSRGIDSRGDLSNFGPYKQLIDNAHRNLPNKVNNIGLSNHDDLIPANSYPCGNATCIHFGADALREMGRRYYQALLRAVQM